ncbi:FITM1 protein, partial [Polypterus senegalus]
MGVEQPVALLSELAACCLGNTYFRRHYHLWMALLVLMGPGLTYYVSHSTVFANKRNFLYLYFLRSGWGWTCLLTGGYLLLVSYSSSRSLGTCLRHMFRLVIATIFWKAALLGFALVENATGSCFEPIRNYEGLEGGVALLLHEAQNKAVCLTSGFVWRGYDISEDTFLLTFASLVMAEEMAVFKPYLACHLPASSALRIVFLMCAALLILWNFLLLCVLVYFQRYTHKLLGGALATLCWRLTYHWWYKTGVSWYSPGRPGVGLFEKADKE